MSLPESRDFCRWGGYGSTNGCQRLRVEPGRFCAQHQMQTERLQAGLRAKRTAEYGAAIGRRLERERQAIQEEVARRQANRVYARNRLEATVAEAVARLGSETSRACVEHLTAPEEIHLRTALDHLTDLQRRLAPRSETENV